MDSLWTLGGAAAHYVLPFLVVLGVVVFVHEFGHYWVARRCGVKIESFSIGFGPEIFGWNDRRGTHWRVAWIPLGGYVKMFGDSDPTSFTPDAETVAAMSDEDKKQAFFAQSVDKRMAISVAGPASNYLFAIVVLAGLFLVNGQPYTSPVVDKVLEGSAAQKADIQEGDFILSVEGKAIRSFEDIKRIVSLNTGTPLAIELERGGENKTLNVTPEFALVKDRLGGEHRLGRLGISSSEVRYRKLSVLNALQQSVAETWNLTASTLQGVGQMVMGLRGTEELGGPLRIAEMSGKTAQEGVGAFAWFLVLISVNLGLINLFPIPLLDGGHLVFYIAEKFRGRQLSERAQDVGATMGGILVAALMVMATWNDLVHLRVVSYFRNLFS